MSLINDAIKRAGQTPAPRTNPAETAAGMRPIEYERPSRFPWAIVIAILVPVFALAIWFIVKGWQLSKTDRSGELVARARMQPAPSTPDPAVVGFQVPQIVIVSNPPAQVIYTSAPVAQVVEPEQPAFPSLKLQGLYWRPSRPSAVINSKTVYVGDRVEMARVTAIDKESVTVQWESETKVLTLR